MKQENLKQIEVAAKVSIGLGSFCLLLFMFADADWGTKLRGSAAGLSLLGWGGAQLALASKREKAGREPRLEDKRLEKQLEKLDQSGSMKNVLTLMSWVLLLVFVACAVCVGWLLLFHRRQ